MAIPEFNEGRCYKCGAITQDGALLCVVHREEAVTYTRHLRQQRKYENLGIATLSVDHRFQRPMNESLVRDIVSNFNELALGTPIVSRRAHEHSIIDGQQRYTALLRMGFAEVTCEVYEGLTFDQEVMAFVVINDGRKAVRRGVLFNDKALGGVPLYRDAQEILNMFGYRVVDPGTRTGVKVGQLSCPSAVEDVHRMGKLAATLYVMQNAWPQSSDQNRREMLMGIAAFLRVNPHVPKEALAEALERFAPSQLLNQAKATASASRERRKWVHMYEQVVQHYNYNRQQQNRVSRLEIPPAAPRMWFL